VFLVHDKITDRHKRIRSFLRKDDYSIAVILAAVDFEWTVRRAIRALGKLPTAKLKEDILNSNERGLKGYKKIWRHHVCEDVEKSLVKVIGKSEWDQITAAFEHRNLLIHGFEGSPHPEEATNSAESLLKASAKINAFTEELNCPIYGKSIRRKKERTKLK
jgi:hypothetical protein